MKAPESDNLQITPQADLYLYFFENQCEKANIAFFRYTSLGIEWRFDKNESHGKSVQTVCF
jgi:hypothetical protein